MIKALLTLTVMLSAANAFAWTSSEPVTKEYVFKFELAGETLEVRRPAASYEDAFDKAADLCFKYFKQRAGGSLTEDKGLDIIDVCANPRS